MSMLKSPWFWVAVIAGVGGAVYLFWPAASVSSAPTGTGAKLVTRKPGRAGGISVSVTGIAGTKNKGSLSLANIGLLKRIGVKANLANIQQSAPVAAAEQVSVESSAAPIEAAHDSAPMFANGIFGRPAIRNPQLGGSRQAPLNSARNRFRSTQANQVDQVSSTPSSDAGIDVNSDGTITVGYQHTNR